MSEEIKNELEEVVEEEEQEDSPDEGNEDSPEEEEEEQEDDEGSPDEGEDDEVDWKERALKAEKLIEKRKKAAKKKPSSKSKAKNDTNVDAKILKSQGYSDELIEQAEKVAQLEDVDLLDAVNTSLFKTIKEQHDEAEKTRKAAVGASRGSGQKKKKEDFSTPGLSEDKHKALFDKAMGNS